MHVISKRGLTKLGGRHPETLDSLISWHKVVRQANWRSFNDVRATFTKVDQVGSVLIFNIMGNKYRLIVRIRYAAQRIWVKELLTHREYDRKEWMKWA
jgi:mRNA interferase HigB